MIINKLKQCKLTDLIALFAGTILPLAFAPFYWYWIAIISPAILLASLSKQTPSRALWRGFLYGLGQFGVGVSWVYVSIHEYGNTIAPVAVLFTFVFVAFLALFPAMQCYLVNRFYNTNRAAKYFIAFPATWMLIEWVRSWILTGFPWLLIAYSQTNSPLRGFIPILGAYGTGFLLLLLSGTLFFIAENSWRWLRYKNYHINYKSVTQSSISLIIIIVLFVAGIRLATISWTQDDGKAVTVTMIQGDIPQDLKWSESHIKPTIKLYNKLTSAHWDSDIIIWPEAALPVPLPQAQAFVDELSKTAKRHNTAVVMGLPVQVPNRFSYYNGIIAIGKGQGHYYKKHLVPFGEYLPFDRYLRGLIGFFDIPMSNMASGPNKQSDLIANGIKIAPFICYEIAYAHDLLTELPAAQIMVTVSNDTWFGDSFAPTQHLQIGQFRAIQGGRQLAYATNNGITALIGANGKIINRIPQFKIATLTVQMQPMAGSTPWLYIGNRPIILGLFILLGIGLIIEWRRERNVAYKSVALTDE